MDEYSDTKMAGYSSGRGYPIAGGGFPGAGGGSPGMVAGGPGAIAGMTGGVSDNSGSSSGAHASNGYPGGVMTQFGNQQFSVDHGDFSRRILLIQLLLTSPRRDSIDKNEIGELLATSLLKRYPQGFLPAPPTENSNVSVYDLIETGFRSGVRYRKRPAAKQSPSGVTSTESVSLEVARFLDTASSVVWNYLPNDRRMQIHQTRVAELQAAQAAGVNSQKLYDGKSFESWLQVVATERSPERLVEAVQALTLLGKDTRSAEAASAIIRSIAPFAPSSGVGKNAESRLFTTINDRLLEFDEELLASIFMNFISTGNSNQRQFILTLHKPRVEGWFFREGYAQQDEFRKALLAASHDESENVRAAAMRILTPLLMKDHASLGRDELEETQNHSISLLDGEWTKFPAAVCLSQLAPHSPGLSNILLADIAEYGKSRRYRTTSQIDAYWTLRRVLLTVPKSAHQVADKLAGLITEIDHRSPVHQIKSTEKFFSHATLLIELLVSLNDQSVERTTEIAGIINNFAKSSAMLPKESESFSIRSSLSSDDAPKYTPVLTDNYEFPTSIATKLQLGTRKLTREAHAAAAKLALEQLEKSSPSDNADE